MGNFWRPFDSDVNTGTYNFGTENTCTGAKDYDWKLIHRLIIPISDAYIFSWVPGAYRYLKAEWSYLFEWKSHFIVATALSDNGLEFTARTSDNKIVLLNEIDFDTTIWAIAIYYTKEKDSNPMRPYVALASLIWFLLICLYSTVEKAKILSFLFE